MAVEGVRRTEGSADWGLRCLVIWVVLPLVYGCGNGLAVDQIPLRSIEGESVQIQFSQSTCTVIYFLSPECPLCINYSRNLKQLASDFANENVRFVGIFSGKWFAADEVKAYSLRYGLPFQMLMDDDLALVKKLNASVTPEAFLLNSSGQVLYSGAIDNWVNDLGKKKLEVTKHYLHEAIRAALAGKQVPVKRTKAVGCLIE